MPRKESSSRRPTAPAQRYDAELTGHLIEIHGTRPIAGSRADLGRGVALYRLTSRRWCVTLYPPASPSGRPMVWAVRRSREDALRVAAQVLSFERSVVAR